MTQQEKAVRNFLIWLRDNDSHEAAWLPEHPRTERIKTRLPDGSVVEGEWPIFTHFRIKGSRQKTVSKAVQMASVPFVDLESPSPGHMYYPNEMGLKIASGEIQGGFLDSESRAADPT